MTTDDMKLSKGLGFPKVPLAAVGHMPAKGEDEQEAVRVLYVTARRVTKSWLVGGSWGAAGEMTNETFNRSNQQR